MNMEMNMQTADLCDDNRDKKFKFYHLSLKTMVVLKVSVEELKQ